MLANFLLHYRATAEQLQQSNAPYTLCSSREHKPFTTSHLTTRASAVWKKLGVDFSAHGCIVARNSSVAALNSAQTLANTPTFYSAEGARSDQLG